MKEIAYTTSEQKGMNQKIILHDRLKESLATLSRRNHNIITRMDSKSLNLNAAYYIGNVIINDKQYSETRELDIFYDIPIPIKTTTSRELYYTTPIPKVEYLENLDSPTTNLSVMKRNNTVPLYLKKEIECTVIKTTTFQYSLVQSKNDISKDAHMAKIANSLNNSWELNSPLASAIEMDKCVFSRNFKRSKMSIMLRKNKIYLNEIVVIDLCKEVCIYDDFILYTACEKTYKYDFDANLAPATVTIPELNTKPYSFENMKDVSVAFTKWKVLNITHAYFLMSLLRIHNIPVLNYMKKQYNVILTTIINVTIQTCFQFHNKFILVAESDFEFSPNTLHWKSEHEDVLPPSFKQRDFLDKLINTSDELILEDSPTETDVQTQETQEQDLITNFTETDIENCTIITGIWSASSHSGTNITFMESRTISFKTFIAVGIQHEDIKVPETLLEFDGKSIQTTVHISRYITFGKSCLTKLVSRAAETKINIKTLSSLKDHYVNETMFCEINIIGPIQSLNEYCKGVTNDVYYKPFLKNLVQSIVNTLFGCTFIMVK